MLNEGIFDMRQYKEGGWVTGQHARPWAAGCGWRFCCRCMEALVRVTAGCCWPAGGAQLAGSAMGCGQASPRQTAHGQLACLG